MRTFVAHTWISFSVAVISSSLFFWEKTHMRTERMSHLKSAELGKSPASRGGRDCQEPGKKGLEVAIV